MDITKEKNDVYAYDIMNNIWKKVSGSSNATTQARSPDGRRKQVNLSNATEEFERKKSRNKTISPIKLAARESLLDKSGGPSK